MALQVCPVIVGVISRGQLLFSLIMGTSAGVLLWVLGVTVLLLLGIIVSQQLWLWTVVKPDTAKVKPDTAKVKPDTTLR